MIRRVLLTVSGRVQGVGFRPFVFRLATRFGLAGTIRNTTVGVEIDLQAEAGLIEQFKEALFVEKPERAEISQLREVELPVRQVAGFTIEESAKGQKCLLPLLPDGAICQECQKELYDPANKRHNYPFLHCMGCGPRFSLFTAMPFDRNNTSMQSFTMCKACQDEYNDPENRRFYSQTNCCPACGPTLFYYDEKKVPIEGSIEGIAQWLSEGKIVALKNTGGYLLLVDATNEEAVMRLRVRKRRLYKPFALLVRKFLWKSASAKRVAESSAAPIVLVEPSLELAVAPAVSLKSPYWGVMLAHNALQMMVLDLVQRPLVATSGNRSGMPLCVTEEEAFNQLEGIADYFVTHNRPIIHRLDDSLVHIIHDRPMILRKARGYIPDALSLPEDVASFAAGGQQKSSFAFCVEGLLYSSQYIGNLESYDVALAYEGEVASWKKLLGVEPTLSIGDKHPGYYTSQFANSHVQHHVAHVYSCMVDAAARPPLLAIAWDGTGYGDDGTIWGGEAFYVTDDGPRRVASLYPFRLPGGDRAVLEPRRQALGLLYALYGKEATCNYFTENELAVLIKSMEKAPICSSIGRLFDAVSALLDLCHVSHYEGHAALMLEAAACRLSQEAYQIDLHQQDGLWLLDWRGMVRQIILDKAAGKAVAIIAKAFHNALVEAVVQLAVKIGCKTVLLTGGVMQNKLLLEAMIDALHAAGFTPIWHKVVPPNDSGLAVGQLARQFLAKKPV